jgi:peptidoglycan/xylan/chitin deacetylase (PgdA/CDA1 family)
MTSATLPTEERTAGAAATLAETPGAFVALMYHNVVPDGERYADVSPSATSYFVSREVFDCHLTRIEASGTRCMDVADLQRFYRAGHGSTRSVQGERGVILTFDDGWRDGVETGGPILERYGCRAILFVTTEFLGKPHFLSRADVARLDPAVFHVGSHARTHRMLSQLNEAEIRAELSESKKILEDLVGYAVETLSIPSGAVDERVRRIAAECGYQYVFDSNVRVNRRGDDRLAIGRVAVMSDTNPAAVDRYIRQNIRRERLRRAALETPKRVLGLRRYERVRRWLLGERRGQQVTHES